MIYWLLTKEVLKLKGQLQNDEFDCLPGAFMFRDDKDTKEKQAKEEKREEAQQQEEANEEEEDDDEKFLDEPQQ